MDQAVIQRHAVEERLEGGARRAQRTHHVDMPEAALVGQVDGAQVGTHRHGLRIDHQDGGGGALRQPRAPAQQQVFEAPLQRCIERGADQRRAVGAVQAPGQQRRQGRFLTWRQHQRFFACLTDLLGRPHLVFGQALQHLVPGALGTLGVAVRAQAAGRLGQHGQQRRFGRGQVHGRLAQVCPTGGRHALQGAAERRTVQVDLQDFALGQMPFQLRRAPQLAQFAGQGALMRVEQARDLHRQRAATRHHTPATQVQPGSAGQGQRVDPRVTVEPAVLVGQQRLQIQRRNLVGADWVTPHAIGIGKAPQRRAVLGQHHAGQVVAWHGQRPEAVGQPQQAEQHQHADHRGAQQPARTGTRPR
ncbi:hypothetical protein D3C72_631000 [compost metagenome]